MTASSVAALAALALPCNTTSVSLSSWLAKSTHSMVLHATTAAAMMDLALGVNAFSCNQKIARGWSRRMCVCVCVGGGGGGRQAHTGALGGEGVHKGCGTQVLRAVADWGVHTQT